MCELEALFQDKKSFVRFLSAISKDRKLIGPLKKDIIRYEQIDNPEMLFLEGRSDYPVKEFFLQKQQVLFEFKGRKAEPKIPDMESRVFVGLRRCELNAIMHHDIVFGEDYEDPYYLALREKSLLIGLHCVEAISEWCFCNSLALGDFFDLMYYDKGDYYLIEVGSEKGEDIVKKFKRYFANFNRELTENEKLINGADRLNDSNIGHLFDNPAWAEGSKNCLSCSACTVMCPSCFCFEFQEEQSRKGSRRIRQWSSCQLPGFTRIAGDYIFRKDRTERFKHRIFHQLQYFKEKHGINLCVGCGRCIEHCPTVIDWVKMINDMQKR